MRLRLLTGAIALSAATIIAGCGGGESHTPSAQVDINSSKQNLTSVLQTVAHGADPSSMMESVPKEVATIKAADASLGGELEAGFKVITEKKGSPEAKAKAEELLKKLQ